MSVSVSRASAAEILTLLSAVSELTVTADGGLAEVVASGDVSDAPWDCLLQSMAKQLDMQVKVEGQSVRLVPARARK